MRARRFILMDAAGNNLATLQPDDNGACLALSTTTKNSLARICSGDNQGTHLFLIAHNGEAQAIVSTGELTTEPMLKLPPGLIVSAEHGQKMFSLRLGKSSELILRGLTVLAPADQPIVPLRPEGGSELPSRDISKEHR